MEKILDRDAVIKATAAWSESLSAGSEIPPTEDLKQAWRAWPEGLDDLYGQARTYLLMKRGGACVSA